MGCVTANVTFLALILRELLGVCPELADGHGKLKMEIEHRVRITDDDEPLALG
jgi:hypothetical protein